LIACRIQDLLKYVRLLYTDNGQFNGPGITIDSKDYVYVSHGHIETITIITRFVSLCPYNKAISFGFKLCTLEILTLKVLVLYHQVSNEASPPLVQVALVLPE
jgi:hypothetical protein